MNDLREAVARATWKHGDGWQSWNDAAMPDRAMTYRQADAAIAAVLEHLASAAYQKACEVTHQESDSGTDWFDVPDWLRSFWEAGQ